MTDETDINMLADTLGELFERAEDLFSRYQVAAMVPAEGGYLGFKKWTKSKSIRVWRLVWVGDSGQAALLVSMSRGTRVKAVKAMPALHRALLEQQGRVAKDTRAAIEELETFLDKLEESHADD